MKKYLLIIFLLTLICNTAVGYSEDKLDCPSSVLVDAHSGKILFSNHSDEIRFPASLTKVMTAILALEMGDFSDILTVDDSTPYTIDGSHIALEPGEQINFVHMLNALLIASANDVAEVIAINYEGSVESFVDKMNEKAVELGMSQTHFTNPHGLHDENHYSTAEDMAKLAVYAYKNETIREIIERPNYTIPPTNIKNEERYLNNSNRLLSGVGYGNQIIIDGYYVDIKYEGATGFKTGYTPEAGSCLIGSAKKDDLELISVVLGGYITEVYSDTVKLFNYGFDHFENVQLVESGMFYKNARLDNLVLEEVPLITSRSLSAVIPIEMKASIYEVVDYYDYDIPLSKDERIAFVSYYIDNELLGSVDLISPIQVNAIGMPNESDWDRLVPIIKQIVFLISIIILLVFLLRVYNILRIQRIRRKRKKKTGL